MQNSRTHDNLQAAFAGESMANRKYLYFAKVARKLGNEEIAQLFEETAHQETGHAFSHLELMYPPSSLTVERLLELAIEGELYETNKMYPEFEQIALQEGEHAAVEEFREQAAESAEHAAIFQQAAKRFKALTLVEGYHARKYQQALEEVKNAATESGDSQKESANQAAVKEAAAKDESVKDELVRGESQVA